MSSPIYQPPLFADKDRLAKIQSLFPAIEAMYHAFAEKNHFPGYAFGIMVDEVLVHSGSHGYLDINKRIPATPQSMFRIASMTKSFTALAILILRDQGKLRLEDSVSLLVSEIANQRLTQDAPTITIRDLLIHAAGFPSDDPWADRKLDESDQELLELLKKGIFFSNPAGTIYEYSNLGYALLGYLIKKITGVSCGKFISEHIWKPIGLKQASWDFSEVPSSQLALGYRWNNENWKEEELLHDGAFGPMGGMITSIESFSRYVALHQSAWPPRDDKEAMLIKRSLLREMHQPWKFCELIPDFKYPDGRECPLVKGYGYGLNWSRDGQGRVYVGHSGGLPGFGSNWRFMPEYGIGVILFANVTYAPTDLINLAVLDMLIKTAPLEPRKLPISQALQNRQKAFVKLLPHWENAAASGIFAENFFLDNPINLLKQESDELFTKAGPIISVKDIVPENQLRGSFLIECEKADLQVSFALTPENPPLIQKFQIKKEKN